MSEKLLIISIVCIIFLLGYLVVWYLTTYIDTQRAKEKKIIEDSLAIEPYCETWLILKNSERLYFNTFEAEHWVSGIIISAKERAETYFDRQLKNKIIKVPILKGENTREPLEDKTSFRLVDFNEIAQVEFKILTKN